MPAESTTTTDQDRSAPGWTSTDGHPAHVLGTGDGGDRGVLRIDFPQGADEDELEHISWDEWFDAFESNDLALVYQERKASGETFAKLVSR